jgi:N-acylglucosamine 2-epimerase
MAILDPKSQLPERLKIYADQYRHELLDEVIPFWLRNSPDKEFGGFFTCLDQQGKVYDTDKFIWLQGRQVWCFSMLYNRVEKKQAWLDMALSGADFLEKYGRSASGDWYFSLERTGKPLIAPYNIFSDCFAVMAFSELYKITGLAKHRDIALETFSRILLRKDNWKGAFSKTVPGTRPLKNFALPMILANLSAELEHLQGDGYLYTMVPDLLTEILDQFYQPALGIVLENISPDGSFVDCFDGRLINPGHAIEAMWFVMDLGARLGKKEVIEKATQIALDMVEYGWDSQYGGIYYFMDAKGVPMQQLEWDQKLWWVHAEALVAMAKGYALTGNPACLTAFEKIHAYTWNHFRDPAGGDWFGYLHRNGALVSTMKGGKWKGCFHIPRSLFQVWKTFERLYTESVHENQQLSTPL